MPDARITVAVKACMFSENNLLPGKCRIMEAYSNILFLGSLARFAAAPMLVIASRRRGDGMKHPAM